MKKKAGPCFWRVHNQTLIFDKNNGHYAKTFVFIRVHIERKWLIYLLEGKILLTVTVEGSDTSFMQNTFFSTRFKFCERKVRSRYDIFVP
jgi:hypothetical protein